MEEGIGILLTYWYPTKITHEAFRMEHLGDPYRLKGSKGQDSGLYHRCIIPFLVVKDDHKHALIPV